MEKTAANRRGARSGQVLRALRRGHGASPGWTWPTAELGLGRETPGPADGSQGASPRRCCPGPVRPGGKTGPRPVSSGAARRGRSRAKWASTPARAGVCANRTALAGSDTAEPDEGPGRHEHRGGGSAPRGHPRGGPGATTGRPLRARLLTRCRRVEEGRVPPPGGRGPDASLDAVSRAGEPGPAADADGVPRRRLLPWGRGACEAPPAAATRSLPLRSLSSPLSAPPGPGHPRVPSRRGTWSHGPRRPLTSLIAAAGRRGGTCTEGPGDGAATAAGC